MQSSSKFKKKIIIIQNHHYIVLKSIQKRRVCPPRMKINELSWFVYL